MRPALILGLGLILAAGGAAAQGGDPTALRLHGYAQLWWTLYEGAENGLRQPVTHDDAADYASGFLLNRARLVGDFGASGLTGRVSVRLEGSPPALLDAYVVLPLRAEMARLWIGQMKLPATYEVATPSERLDFTARSRFSELVVDYSLSRSPAMASRLTGIRCYLRDLGVGVKGAVSPVRYFFMISNGLGANHFIGGPGSREEVYANELGAYAYAARITCDLLSAGQWDPDGESTTVTPGPPSHSGSPRRGRFLTALIVGGHASSNQHPDLVLDDRRTVLDIRRRAWSADLRCRLAGRLELTGLYGAGEVDDDIDSDSRTDYRYRGWEAKLIVQIAPGHLRAGLRYDALAEESYDNGVEEVLHSYTVGLTWLPRAQLRAQLNYRHNVLDSDSNPDLDDDALITSLQVEF